MRPMVPTLAPNLPAAAVTVGLGGRVVDDEGGGGVLVGGLVVGNRVVGIEVWEVGGGGGLVVVVVVVLW